MTKRVLLEWEEPKRRLKTNDIFLVQGDEIANFFHTYSEHMNHINTLCEMERKIFLRPIWCASFRTIVLGQKIKIYTTRNYLHRNMFSPKEIWLGILFVKSLLYLNVVRCEKEVEDFVSLLLQKESKLLVADFKWHFKETCPKKYDNNKNKHIVQPSFGRLHPSSSL